MTATKPFEVKVGGNKVILKPSDYITSGGEGSIYRQRDVIYKIYAPGRTGLNAMAQKFLLLSAIKHKGISAPQDVVHDLKGNLVGFTMPYVTGEVLVRFFNNDFRNQHKFGLQETIKVAQGMKEIVAAAHAHKALIVDGNEMNYLVNGDEPCIIDVDSWEIDKFKATAIMPSIRDYQSSGFGTLTDWYSWGIVSFQLFTGIHPFKGKHPKYKPTDMVDRMKKNVSVFNSHVLLPSAARDLKEIPTNLKDWYEAEFEKGVRTLPPDNFVAAVQPKVIQKTVYKSTGKIVFTKIKEFQENILQYFPNGMVITGERAYSKTSRLGIELHRMFPMLVNNNYHCISTDFGQVLAKDGCDSVALINGDSFEMLPLLERSTFFSGAGRLFRIVDAGIMEVNAVRLGTKVSVFPGAIWRLNPQSTYFGKGAAVYDALGTPFLVMPMGVAGCLVNRQDELKDKVIIDVKGIDKFVTCLVKDRSGQNFKVELFYKNQYSAQPWVGSTDETGLNFAVNHRGTVATVVDDGELVLFSPTTGQSSKVTDKHIKADMALCTVDDNIGFTKDNEIWSISTT